MIGTTRHPILFKLAGLRSRNSGLKGMGPYLGGFAPLPTGLQRITGIAKDSTGAVLAGATVTLFRTSDNQPCGSTVSGSDGSYVMSVPYGLGEMHFIVAYKAGAPDVAGTTVNTLVGV